MTKPLFAINPALDVSAAHAAYSRHGRVQIRNVLTEESARTLHAILTSHTPWGLAWRGGDNGPHSVRHAEFRALAPADRQAMTQAMHQAMAGNGYAFHFGQYPMLDAYLQKWHPGGPHDMIMEHLNDQPFLDLVRQVSGLANLIKADGQATLYAPGHFLAQHDDSHVAEGWQLAYVLNLCAVDWRPDWGGYLNFLNEDGDVVEGFRPRFNALNLFRVPQLHQVSYVPPFAPVERLAITGWVRDR